MKWTDILNSDHLLSFVGIELILFDKVGHAFHQIKGLFISSTQFHKKEVVLASFLVNLELIFGISQTLSITSNTIKPHFVLLIALFFQLLPLHANMVIEIQLDFLKDELVHENYYTNLNKHQLCWNLCPIKEESFFSNEVKLRVKKCRLKVHPP